MTVGQRKFTEEFSKKLIKFFWSKRTWIFFRHLLNDICSSTGSEIIDMPTIQCRFQIYKLYFWEMTRSAQKASIYLETLNFHIFFYFETFVCPSFEKKLFLKKIRQSIRNGERQTVLSLLIIKYDFWLFAFWMDRFFSCFSSIFQQIVDLSGMWNF